MSRARTEPLSTADAGKPSPCMAFCERASTICSGEYAVYHGVTDCLGACGTMTDSDRECREEELSKAAASHEPNVYCHALSVGGSDACGGNCENYCNLMARVCKGRNRDPNEVEDCEAKCAVLIDRERIAGLPATASRYNVDADHEGDTLQCRLVHLTIAAQVDAEGHCWHAALAPRPQEGQANPCATGYHEEAPRCEDYCQIVMAACPQDQQVYESKRQCLAVCDVLPKGNVGSPAQGDDSVACRKIHAYNAAMYADPATHCPHAGPGGGQVCGDDCPAYCTMLEAGCEAEFRASYGEGAAGLSSCQNACGERRSSEHLDYNVADADAPAADPVACGLLYAARALQDRANAVSHCASAMGGAKCGQR